MDILLSNIPAITAGLWAVNALGIRSYDFLGRRGKKSIWEWEMFHCHKRFGVIVYQQVLLLIHFLNGFFLNNVIDFTILVSGSTLNLVFKAEFPQLILD